MLSGVDLYTLRMDRALNVLQELWVQDTVVEKEIWEARSNVRSKLDAQLMHDTDPGPVATSSTSSDGAVKPMIQPTQEVEGPNPFPGLEPPLGG